MDGYRSKKKRFGKVAAWRDRDRADIEVRDLVEQIGSAPDDPLRLAAFDEMVRRAGVDLR